MSVRSREYESPVVPSLHQCFLHARKTMMSEAAHKPCVKICHSAPHSGLERFCYGRQGLWTSLSVSEWEAYWTCWLHQARCGEMSRPFRGSTSILGVKTKLALKPLSEQRKVSLCLDKLEPHKNGKKYFRIFSPTLDSFGFEKRLFPWCNWATRIYIRRKSKSIR